MFDLIYDLTYIMYDIHNYLNVYKYIYIYMNLYIIYLLSDLGISIWVIVEELMFVETMTHIYIYVCVILHIYVFGRY